MLRRQEPPTELKARVKSPQNFLETCRITTLTRMLSSKTANNSHLALCLPLSRTYSALIKAPNLKRSSRTLTCPTIKWLPSSNKVDKRARLCLSCQSINNSSTFSERLTLVLLTTYMMETLKSVQNTSIEPTCNACIDLKTSNHNLRRLFMTITLSSPRSGCSS